MPSVNEIAKTTGKLTTGGLFFDLAQHATPMIVGKILVVLPSLGEPLAYEIVVALESSIAMFLAWISIPHIKATWDFFINVVVGIILSARSGWRKISNAATTNDLPVETEKKE